MTTPLSRYREIADLVKGWADRIEHAYDTDVALGNIVEDMRAFSNGLVATVNDFTPALEVETVSTPVMNCRRFPTEHPYHYFNDHGTEYVCRGEGGV